MFDIQRGNIMARNGEIAAWAGGNVWRRSSRHKRVAVKRRVINHRVASRLATLRISKHNARGGVRWRINDGGAEMFGAENAAARQSRMSRQAVFIRQPAR